MLGLALLSAGCGSKPVFSVKIDKVDTPGQIQDYERRLPGQPSTAVTPQEGQMFVVVSAVIRNPTRRGEVFDQNKVQLVGRYGNAFDRFGVSLDCGATPSVMAMDAALEKLNLGPGEALPSDPQTSCFVFQAPSNEGPYRLRAPGAQDVLAPLPAPMRDSGVAGSGAPTGLGRPAPSSAGTS